MIVVDASVWVSSMIVDDADHAISWSWVSTWALEGGHFAAPVLLLAEVAGAVARRTRRPSFSHLALTNMMNDPILHLHPVDDALAAAAARIAADLSLRGADAVYVALAHQLRAPLVSWDREHLSRAAGFIEVRAPDA